MTCLPEQVIADMITQIRKEERRATEERIIKTLEDFMNSKDLEPEAADGIYQVLLFIKAKK
jgi:hypothetical protein